MQERTGKVILEGVIKMCLLPGKNVPVLWLVCQIWLGSERGCLGQENGAIMILEWGKLRHCLSWNSVSAVLGVCLTESWSDLVLTTEGAEGTRLLPICAWGCPRALKTNFPPVSASGKTLICSHLGGTEFSHLTFSRKLPSCGLPRPYLPPTPPWPPPSPHLMFPSCSAELFLFEKPLSYYFFYYHVSWGTFLDFTGLATGFQPAFFLCLGKERAENLACWEWGIVSLGKFSSETVSQ